MAVIERALKEWRATPLAKTDSGELAPPPGDKPVRVSANNALDALGKLCTGKMVCELPVESDTFGVEPMAECFKRLKVSYRCYSYDKLWYEDVGQSETLKIDCGAPEHDPV